MTHPDLDPGRTEEAGTARAVWFTAPRRAEVLRQRPRERGEDDVVVKAVNSLISAGTEMLVYRGQYPASAPLGAETCEGSFAFPVKYGYQVVGRVVEAGARSGYQPGALVFARHPHQDLFTIRAAPRMVVRVPQTVSPRMAMFTNLAEVALNCLLDVPVRHGDVVVVFGQGVVGLFCAQLARRTAGKLIVVDPIEKRRALGLSLGADAAVAPADAAEVIAELSQGRGADICLEASGSPPALQAALESTGLEGTIGVVSSYGSRTVPLVLWPEFHRGRLRIISSQVGQLGSGLQPRWDAMRRTSVVMDLLPHLHTEEMISREVPLDRAAEAYDAIDQRPEEVLGVALTYDS